MLHQLLQHRLLLLAASVAIICSSVVVVVVFGSVHNQGGVRRRSSSSSLRALQRSSIDAALFEGDLLVSYNDIAANYGEAVADKLVDSGFAFTDSNHSSIDTARKLGLTNEYLQRTWNTPHHRQTSTGKLRIPYVIENTIQFQQNNNETLTTIQKALAIIEQTTGIISFVPRQSATTDVDYINFRYMANTCAATLGRSSPSFIYIGWCNTQAYIGEIIHEILHTLGFWHEQSRPDRDSYLIYNKRNVISGMEINFEKQININSLGSMYDYASIMHYPANAFSIYPSNSLYNTLVPTDEESSAGSIMGQSLRMSPTDVQQLRLLYQCNTGPRNINDITIDNLCSINCKCWEYAMGTCHNNDDECMGDLICSAPPSSSSGTIPTGLEYQDMLPMYNLTSVPRFHVGYCSTYCHADCCHLMESQVLCPNTCDTWSPAEEELPRTMCLPSNVGGSPTTVVTATTSPTTNPTSAPTSSRPTTLKPTSARPILSSPPPSVGIGGYTPTTQWFVDWSRNGGMCVADCEGTQPCGRKRHTWEAGYISVQVCCSTMSWKPYNDCSYAIVSGTTTTTTTSTTSATTPATSTMTTTRATAISTTSTAPGTVTTSTAATTTSTIPRTVATTTTTSTTTTSTSTTTTASTSTATTSSPTASPVTSKPTSRPSSHPTVTPTLKPTAGPTMSVITTTTTTTVIPPVNTLWYPDPAGSTKCKNDGLAPSWLHHKYTTQSTCCSSYFSWGFNDCMGTKPTSSNKWYIDWSIGKCKQDCEKSSSSSTTCGGVVPGTWILLHSTSDACCRAHVSYAVDQCKTLG